MKLLLDNKKEENLKDKEGKTFLHWAAEYLKITNGEVDCQNKYCSYATDFMKLLLTTMQTLM